MEIERKYLVKQKDLPNNLEQYEKNEISQAYILTDPVLRIRRRNNDFIFTYKGQGLIAREEIEAPLNEEAYNKLLPKAEGNPIEKTRYKIPYENGLTIELDIFKGLFDGLILAEVEFKSIEDADSFKKPEWFFKDVSDVNTFHNSTLSKMSKDDIPSLIKQTQEA